VTAEKFCNVSVHARRNRILHNLPHCPAGVRFSLLNDGRCLTAEAGFGCGVALAPCAEAGEVNATLQAWRARGQRD